MGEFIERIIMGAIIGGFIGWLVGLFYHCCWWSVTGMTFEITSGIILYTTPYAVIGAIVGVILFLRAG